MTVAANNDNNPTYFYKYVNSETSEISNFKMQGRGTPNTFYHIIIEGVSGEGIYITVKTEDDTTTKISRTLITSTFAPLGKMDVSVARSNYDAGQGFDDFSLSYDVSSYLTRASTASADALTLSSQMMDNTVKTALTSARTSTSSFMSFTKDDITASNIDDYISAIATLEDAVLDAQASADEYATWKAVYDAADANALLVSSACQTSFRSYASTLLSAYTGGTLSLPNNTNAVKGALAKALIDAGETNLTGVIYNNGFELGTFDGWTADGEPHTDGSDLDNNGGVVTSTPKVGDYRYYTGWSGRNINQKVIGLPKGRYTLTAKAYSWGASCALVANGGASSVTSSINPSADMSYTFEVAGNEDYVNLGIAGTDGASSPYASGGSWGYFCDDFGLTYVKTLENDATTFTSGSTMTANQWYKIVIGSMATYDLSAGTDLANIVFTKDGTLSYADATTNANDYFLGTYVMLPGTYYIMSTSEQTFTFVAADDYTDVRTLDFENAASYTDGWTKSANYDVTLSQVDHNSGKCLYLNGGSSRGSTLTYSFASMNSFTSAEEYKIEFDYATCGIGSNNNAEGGVKVYSNSNVVFDMNLPNETTTTLTIKDASGTALTTVTVPQRSSTPSPWMHVILIGNSSGLFATVTNTTAGTVLVDNVKVSSSAVNITSFAALNGRSYQNAYLDDLILSVKGDVVVQPIASITAVNGTSRTITMTQSQDAAIHYYECANANYNTDGLTPKDYSEPFSISTTQYLSVYATKGGKTSDFYNIKLEAGSNVSLATPSVAMQSVETREGYLAVPVFKIYEPDNSGVLLRPETETLSYTFTPSGGSESGRTEITTGATYEPTANGTLTVYATTEGYTESSYSIPVSNYYTVSSTQDYTAITPEGTWTDRTSTWGRTAYRVEAVGTWNQLNISNANTIDYVPGFGFVREGNSYNYSATNGVKGQIFVPTFTTVSDSPVLTYSQNLFTSNGSKSFSADADRAVKQIEYYSPADLPASVSKTITSVGWATYCSPYALDLTEDITNLTDAYIVTGGTGDKEGVLLKTSVKGGTVPANTGLLLKGTAGTVTIPVVASSSTEVSSNKLVGVTSNTLIDAKAGYVLMNDASNGLNFYLNNNAFTVGANTAYLPANFTGGSARAAFYSFDDETTGINVNDNLQLTTDNSVYNLQGQRIDGSRFKVQGSSLKSGLYIINGKKVIVK